MLRATGLSQPLPIKDLAFRVLVRIIIPLFLETYVLPGSVVYALQAVASGLLVVRDPTSSMKRWLSLREHGRGTILRSPCLLYQEYHASHLQRIFLRCILLRYPDAACVAGGFVLASFLGGAFQADDIDLFLSYEVDVDDISDMYDAIVLGPLGHLAACTMKGLVSFSFAAMLDTTGGDAEQTSLAQSLCFSRVKFLDYIESFLEDRNYFQHCPEGDQYCEQLRLTPAFLPSCFRLPSYRVLRSERWMLQHGERMHPAVLRPINCVVVKPLTFSSEFGELSVVHADDFPIPLRSASPPPSFASQVCCSFDLLPCAISLIVLDDLSFDYNDHNHACACALNRELQFQGCLALPDTSEKSMEFILIRVLKYLGRGFAWKGPTLGYRA